MLVLGTGEVYWPKQVGAEHIQLKENALAGVSDPSARSGCLFSCNQYALWGHQNESLKRLL